ncbi:MAG: hypothetical protein AAF633_03905, partial [Chloroflexota bacterium]
LGKAISAYTLLVFAPRADGQIILKPTNYPSEASFFIEEIGVPDFSDWSRYARGAAKVLNKHTPLQQGLTGLVSGTLPGSGLSSSASVGLAYLRALAAVNELELSNREYVELDRQLENDYLGLNNGIQDQSAIVNGERDKLMHLHTLTRVVDQIEDGSIMDGVSCLIVYSGFSRELTSTGFNDRVGECRQAANMMGMMIDQEAHVLSDIPADAFDALKNELPDHIQRRAAHYYSEVERVQLGREAWAAGDTVRFGELMNESCESSIHQYQSGSEPIIALQEIVSSAPGIYGSRFGGGGYGGCVIGFVRTEAAEDAYRQIRRRYASRYPDAAQRAGYYIAQFENGLRIIH